MSDQLRVDGFLGGRLNIAQPVDGYRSGADAVMLAAAVDAEAGDEVLELGCGAGVATLCLAWRVQGLALTGLEIQESYARLARQNAEDCGIKATIIQGDLGNPPAELKSRIFDHVLCNPPYFCEGTPAPDQGRAAARHESRELGEWIDVGIRRLRQGGILTLIQRAERLDQICAALHGRAGDLRVLPIAARKGRAAGRVIVSARKEGRGPVKLLAPFIMHEGMQHVSDDADLSAEAQAVLRDGSAINL